MSGPRSRARSCRRASHPSDPEHVPLRSRKYWDQISRDVKPVYTAPTPADALRARDEFLDKWGRAYPAIRTLWLNAWEEFIPFLDYDVEIRKVICSTNDRARERPLPASCPRPRALPNEQAAMKTLYLVTRSLDPRAPVRHDGSHAGSQH